MDGCASLVGYLELGKVSPMERHEKKMSFDSTALHSVVAPSKIKRIYI